MRQSGAGPAPLAEPGLDFRSVRDHLFHLTVRPFHYIRRLSTVENFNATARSIGVELGHEPLQSLILVPDKVLVGHDVRSVAGHVVKFIGKQLISWLTRRVMIHRSMICLSTRVMR